MSATAETFDSTVVRYRQLDATLVVMPALHFGALSEQNLRCAKQFLEDAIRCLDTRYLVVEIGEIPSGGARFLGLLIEIAKRLRAKHKRLLVCGDRWNLCRSARLHRLLSAFPHQESVMTWLATSYANDSAIG